MHHQAASSRSLRVAVIGSGPAGFYAADALLKAKGPQRVDVDLFEKLPTPFGLVRSGVAPDHQSVKKVTKAFERVAANERFRFLGNVQVGKAISHEELLTLYDQVLYSVGAPSDRRLGIGGEEARGSYPATDFVGYYNGHPEYRSLEFDLGRVKRVVIVGLGNVAMDLARILARRPSELEATDIASYALNALKQSAIEEVVLLGRRGPVQAAFSPKELIEITELEGVNVHAQGGLDSIGDVEQLRGPARQNAELIQELAKQPPSAEPGTRRVTLRFLASPVNIQVADGRVSGVEIEHNKLVCGEDGRLRAHGTGETELLPCQAIFRSIGYQGTPIAGLPFDERTCTVPNVHGRVSETLGGAIVPRVYVAGWIKRGPTGLIGANKTDAKETVECMLADAAEAMAQSQISENPEEKLNTLLLERDVRVIGFADWERLDALEVKNGEAVGKVREKFYATDEMLRALT